MKHPLVKADIDAGCTGKQAFPSPAAARMVAGRVNRNKASPSLNVYRCSACGSFHIGKSSTK